MTPPASFQIHIRRYFQSAHFLTRFAVCGMLLGSGLLCAAQAQQAAPIPVLPGQVQPVAPGTKAAPKLSMLTLNPPIPAVQSIEYLSNGFIEVAHVVLTVSPEEKLKIRPLLVNVVQRVLKARGTLSEVDVSIYNRPLAKVKAWPDSCGSAEPQ